MPTKRYTTQKNLDETVSFWLDEAEEVLKTFLPLLVFLLYFQLANRYTRLDFG